MNMLQMITAEAARNAPHLTTLRETLVKEILHHEILLQMRNLGLLQHMVFIGGTCLRACYGADRLSEDLDFTTTKPLHGSDFEPLVSRMPELLQGRFGIPVSVKPPKISKEGDDVVTWKFSLEIEPQNRAAPKQKIHVDICDMPSFDIQPMMLRNHYGVDLGTSGLILNTESLSEILADKILAFALRPNRIKGRDVWDIIWLTNKGVELPTDTLLRKAEAKGSTDEFKDALSERLKEMDSGDVAQAFKNEMRRFLPGDIVQQTIMNPGFWNFAKLRVGELSTILLKSSEG
ncbi:MAG: nucleotidyl transferase AbiEii/AbiGii toxin family protein [Pseudodesulfovibrio sp.]|nr:nucleotidyl transferase AbiEii/AbiGii toxin family protein [Pseudodesulfovibrio sp.]